MQGRFKREGSAAGDAELSGRNDRSSSAGPALGGDPARKAAGGDQPTQEHAGEDAADSPAPSPAPARPSQAGSRLALRNWRISTRLVSLIALPVVAATILGGLRIQSSLDDIEQLDNMQLLTELTRQTTLLAAALQEERDRSAGPMVSAGNETGEKSDEVAGARERTDDAIRAFSDARLQIDASDEAMRSVEATVVDIGSRLNEISQIRNGAYEDADYVAQTISRYNELIEALHGLSQDMAQATSNTEMIQSTRALATFSAAKEHASIQRAVITAGLARDERSGQSAGLSESDWRYGRTHQQGEDAALDSFALIYGEDRADEMLNPLDGGIANVVEADQYARQVFASLEGIRVEPRSYRDWYDQDRAKIDAMAAIERTLLDEMAAQASALRDDAQRDSFINGAIVLLVLGISLVGAFVVARSMVRSLRRLQDTAQEVARTRLPEVVRRMSEAEPEAVDTSVESVGVHSRDEIGKVAQAFDDVHREAVRLAGEQALLRGNVNAMFTNLSRRSQGLIQRQLSLISELESREADPDQLSSLFKLDHLATRMRRNGENLLVLAGEEPGRRWTRPVPLVDVLRAAASEVEQYERIELSAVPKSEVAGRVVNDLVHLLAELLENATSFSSPQTKVKVTGHALPDGRVLVEIHDTGIGLSPEDLAEINDRLANPPTVDVSVSRRMGLFVVGRLSLRHNIRIQLRPSDSGGTTALVMLPADVANGAGRPRPGASAPGGPQAATAQRGPATAQGGGPGPDTAELPGWNRSLERTAEQQSRGQVGGGQRRPALPSRPVGSAGPGADSGAQPGAEQPAGAPQQPLAPQAGAPAPPQPARERPAEQGRRHEAGEPQPPRVPQQPQSPAQPQQPLPGGPQGGRPSWAAGPEDSGRIPALGDPADEFRGHDESESTGERARPGYLGAEGPGHTPAPSGPSGAPAASSSAASSAASMSSAFGHRRSRQRQQPPEETSEFAFPGQDGHESAHRPPYAQTHHDTGEYPQYQQAPDRHPQEPAASDAYGEPPAEHLGYQGQAPQAPPPHRPDELRDPLPAALPERGSERTPIFEEMESTWFGLRRAPVPPPAPAQEQAAPPQPAAAPAPLPVREPEPVPQAGASYAQPGHDPEAQGDPGAPWRPSPNDERWRRAEQLRQPSAGGVTTSGLPRRVPRANLMAGAAQSQAQAAPAGPQVSRRPDDVRGRLTNLRRGIQQGRQAGSAAGRTDQGYGPTYQ
ncbi:sensor histidine kinase [Streptomyces marincola]|uniref:sensor histidine kinase n=1 Tax=Streptomyces marincola TaxID=2878388 RepID=UPI001CF41050|nr:nitrate- and nitrite sensing domain-containing protein [Streptomyces marincola]UCM90677.1 nitrate- and nitrite sensing domain-containing protein [Streptomyces marincola]